MPARLRHSGGVGSGLARKYLFYAIGEIALVVIGILIALQINNLNEDRKDRKKEQLILLQLKDDFETNLEQLESRMGMRKQIIEFSQELLGYIDGSLNVTDDSIVLRMTILYLVPTFDPVSNDLSQSGNLRIIQDEKLKHLLSSWTSDVVQIVEEEKNWVQLRNNLIIPYFINEGIARDANHGFWKNQGSQIYQLDKNVKSEIRIGRSDKSVSIEDLFKNKDFEGLLATAITMNHSTNLESEGLRKIILNIIDLIEQNLN